MPRYEGMGSAHISSMDNPAAQASLLWLNDPLALPWHMVAMESVYLLCMGLVVLHAVRAHRWGDRTAPFTVLGLLVYGVTIEALSAAYVNNFWHGEFTVMLLHNRLPLYILASYTIIYFAVKMVERLGMGALAEACSVGLLMLCIDLLWENFGPQLGWWIWSDTDPSVAIRWWDAPVSCHLWQMFFSGSFALMNRKLIAEWAASRPYDPKRLLAAAIATGLATVVLGTLLLQPSNWLLAHPWMVHGYAIVWIVTALAVALSADRNPVFEPDAWLLSVPALLIAFYTVVFAVVYGQAATIALGGIGLGLAVHRAHRMTS